MHISHIFIWRRSHKYNNLVVTIGFVNVCSKGGHETYSHRVIPFALGCLFNATVVCMWLIFVLTSVLLIIHYTTTPE
jgi:hypothetical protein